MDNNTKIETAVEFALEQLGKPYAIPADPPKSWDCSTLTRWAWLASKIEIGPNTWTQAEKVKKLSEVSVGSNNGLQLGDLLFFFKNDTHHVSMYIGGGEVIEAPAPGGVVKKTPVWSSWNSQNFSFAGRPVGILPYDGNGTGGGGGGSDEEDSDTIATNEFRKIDKKSLAKSIVVGTPQTARFALLNLATETIYLTSDEQALTPNPQLYIKANIIVPGDSYEISREIPNASGNYEIQIESNYIQSKEQAETILRMISKSISNPTKSISVKIFGNPLVQLGDIVKFNFFTNKIESDSSEYYIIQKIQHEYNNGLSTTLTIKPLIESVSVV